MAQARRTGAPEQVLSFIVSGAAYAIPAEAVLEVVRKPAITRVPHAPADLAGLMNFHGTAIPVILMSKLLGDAGPAGTSGAKIIVYGEASPVGLLVDEVLQLGSASGQQTVRPVDVEQLLATAFAGLMVPRSKVLRQAAEETKTTAGEAVRALLTFLVGGQGFALLLEDVLEVAVLRGEVAAMPRSDATVVGLFQLRDEVLPLISLAGLLGLARETASERLHVVVIQQDGVLIGLVAGAIEGVRRIGVSAIEPVPAILQRGEGDAEIDAIARVGGERRLVSILSPKKLFGNREIGKAIDQMSARTADMSTEGEADADRQQFVIFELGSEKYGIPIAAVDEILQLPEITRVPKAPGFVTGVINLRGKALPVIDQRRRFETNAAGDSRRPRVIVLTIGQLQAGFIVDGVSEILRLTPASITPAPDLPGEATRIFDRVATSEERA